MAGAPMKLTPKQARFVQEYLTDSNPTQAAVRAGYSAKTARVIGHENRTKLNVAAAIEKARTAHAERAELTADWVIDELRKIAAANLADYVSKTSDGDPYLDFSALTRDQTAALSEVTVEDFVDGRGQDARAVRRVKFKLYFDRTGPSLRPDLPIGRAPRAAAVKDAAANAAAPAEPARSVLDRASTVLG